MSRPREEFQVIPKAVLFSAVLIAGAVVTLIFFVSDEMPGARLAIGGIAATILSLYILLVGYVYADAKRRGMRHVLWTHRDIRPLGDGTARLLSSSRARSYPMRRLRHTGPT
jgi:hypothetical protein